MLLLLLLKESVLPALSPYCPRIITLNSSFPTITSPSTARGSTPIFSKHSSYLATETARRYFRTVTRLEMRPRRDWRFWTSRGWEMR